MTRRILQGALALVMLLYALTSQAALAQPERLTPLSLKKFGAVGDNSTDDTAALQLAFTSAKGRCLDGGGQTYRVRGTLRAADDFCLTNTRLRQDVEPFDTTAMIRGVCPPETDPSVVKSCGDPPILPGVSHKLSSYLSTRTLLIRPEASQAPIAVTLRKVSVDRGNDPSSGSRSDAAGIWIGKAKKVDLEDVEVTGAGKGFGLIIVESNNIRANRLWLHDMVWAPYTGDTTLTFEGVRAHGWNAAPIREFRQKGQDKVKADGFYGMRVQEQLTCIMILNSHDIILTKTRVKGCLARFSEGDIPWQADGIAVGQSTSNIRMFETTISDTWEAIDIVGSGTGVSSVTIDNARITNSFGYGIKWGHSLEDAKLTNSTISLSGLAGVVIYGSVKTALLRNVEIDKVGTIRLGKTMHRAWLQERAGVLIEPGSSPERYPIGVSLNEVFVNGGENCRFGLLALSPTRLPTDGVRALNCDQEKNAQAEP